MFCKYKNALGKPNQGVHKYRIFNISVFDVSLTIFAAIIISGILKINFAITLLLLFLTGIFLHRIFCVRTTIDKFLFN